MIAGRYKIDPEFRDALKRYQHQRYHSKLKHDPLWCRISYLRLRIRILSSGKVRKPRTPIETLRSELDDLVRRRKQIRETNRKPRDRRNRKRRGRTDDQMRRDKQTQQANMLLSSYRKQAAQERKDFDLAWEKKWRPLIGIRRRNLKKGTRKRRDALIVASQKLGDHALHFQIRSIRNGPCKCFWCDTYLPNGGTVDHILALANGGSHSSDNLCAACSSCNSTKRDLSPEQAGFDPCLF